jgi:uncharacterized protein YbaA (DUF1428 family)
MSKYIDGFVLVVPKGKAEDYKKMAEEGRESWIKHGALEYFECKSDDLKQQEMGPLKSRSFSEMTGAGDEDDVWFSFIVFESKEHRDKVNKKVMAEMDESYADQTEFVSPFDMGKMAYGGFEAVVEYQKA